MSYPYYNHKKELKLLREYHKKLQENQNLKPLTFLKEHYGNKNR